MTQKGKVLIFGANGFVGQELLNELEQNGYRVLGVEKAVTRNRQKVELINCNIENAQVVEKIIFEEKPDFIVNLAAISSIGQSWKNPSETVRINTVGTINILEAIRKSGKYIKVLLIGSSEEYSTSNDRMNELSELHPRNIYGFSKLWQEQIAQLYYHQYGIPIICVRAFNHTGRTQNPSCVIPGFCKRVSEIQKSRRVGRLYVGNLDVYRDISDVRDVVRAYRMLLESNESSGIYNVCSGKSYSLKEILDKVISYCDYKVNVIVDSARVRAMDIPYICGDNTKLREKTGWSPQYSMEDMIKSIYQFYLEKK